MSEGYSEHIPEEMQPSKHHQATSQHHSTKPTVHQPPVPPNGVHQPHTHHPTGPPHPSQINSDEKMSESTEFGTTKIPQAEDYLMQPSQEMYSWPSMYNSRYAASPPHNRWSW